MRYQDRTKEQLIHELTELEKHKILFEGLFEFAPDAILVVNKEGCIVQINREAERMFGYSRDEVLGKPVEIFVPERFRELHVEQRREYVSSPRTRFMGAELELYGRRKDGSEFPVDIMLGPLETEEGVVVLSIIRDITEHRRMEEALRASEEKYRSIFENAVEGIFQISVEGRILAINPALARMLGYGSSEESMAEVADIRKLYFEPGRRLEFMRRMQADGGLTDFEAQVKRKDGSMIWVLINARAVRDSSCRVVSYEGMAMDITSRKRAVRNFQRIIECAPDAIIAIDSKYRVLLINAQTERIFGYTREELLDKPYDILIPQRFRDDHAKYCAGYFSEPVTRIMALHRKPVPAAQRKDGSEFPVEINMSPIETEEEIIILIIIRDITGMKNKR